MVISAFSSKKWTLKIPKKNPPFLRSLDPQNCQVFFWEGCQGAPGICLQTAGPLRKLSLRFLISKASPQLSITEFGCRILAHGTWTSFIGRRLEDHYLVNTRFLSKVPQVNGWRTMTHHWRGVLGPYAFNVKASHFATEFYTEYSSLGIFRKFDFRIWHWNSISNLTG